MNDIRVDKVVRMETWNGGAHPTLVVVGWDIVADCGCMVCEGMRLDRQEPVVGFTSCDVHAPQIEAMHRAYADESVRRAEFDEEGPDDLRPLHDVLVERFRLAVAS